MARKPADQVAASRWPQGRQVVWTAIRTLGKDGSTFTLSDVWTECEREIARATIKTYVQGLARAGFLDARPGAPGKATVYTLIHNPGAEAPRVTRTGEAVTQGLGTEALWRTIKILGAFDCAELALAASTEAAPVSVETAKTYVKFLCHARLLRLVRKGDAHRRARYAFVSARDPGPLAPQIQRIKRVWDPNANAVLWPRTEGDAS